VIKKKRIFFRIGYKHIPRKLIEELVRKFIRNHPPVEPILYSYLTSRYPSGENQRVYIELMDDTIHKLHGIAWYHKMPTSNLVTKLVEENLSSEGIRLEAEQSKPQPAPEPPPKQEIPQSNQSSSEEPPPLNGLTIVQSSGRLAGYLGLYAVMLQDEETFRQSYGRSKFAWSEKRQEWENDIGFAEMDVNQRIQTIFGVHSKIAEYISQHWNIPNNVVKRAARSAHLSI